MAGVPLVKKQSEMTPAQRCFLVEGFNYAHSQKGGSAAGGGSVGGGNKAAQRDKLKQQAAARKQEGRQ